VRRSITAGLIGVVVLAAIGASALATGGGKHQSSGHAQHASGHLHQSGVTIEPLAHATIGEKVRAEGVGIQLRTNGPKDMLTASITVDPGGSFGWHSHPGPVQVAVVSGTFSLTQVENGRCRTHAFGPQDAFVEDGGRVHLGQNDGSEPVRLFATFLARAGTTEFSRPEPTPKPCR
jgi:quercetin dioxygenase-like cupin family protein